MCRWNTLVGFPSFWETGVCDSLRIDNTLTNNRISNDDDDDDSDDDGDDDDSGGLEINLHLKDLWGPVKTVKRA